MKRSIYNFYIDGDDGGKIIYNSYSGKQIQFSEKFKKEYDFLLNDDCAHISEELINVMLKNGFLTDKDEVSEINRSYDKIIYDPEFLEITVLPTDACNFKCVYCYQSGPYHNMNSDTANGLLSFVEANCSKYKRVLLGWFGGEPLLQKDLVVRLTGEIKKICQKHKVAFVSRMSTNGYELDIDTAQKLTKNSLLFYQITIDGTKEIHNFQRPHAIYSDSYEKIIYNLRNIKKSIKTSQLSIACRINVSEKNYSVLETFLDEFKDYFGDDNRFKVLVEPVHDWGGNIAQNKNLVIDGMSRSIVKRFYKLVASKGINVLMPTDFGAGTLLCEASRKNAFVINYNGDILKCTSAIYEKEYMQQINIIGHIDEAGDYWINSKTEDIWLKRNVEKYSCGKCVGFPLCGGSGCVLATNIAGAEYCQNKERIESYIYGLVLYNNIKENFIKIGE